MSTFVRRAPAAAARTQAPAQVPAQASAAAAAASRAAPLAAPAPALPPAPQPLAGTRAGLAGHTVISSGVRALDELLGGGVPLGSLLVVLEDGFSGAHELLLRHFLAEGAACGHRCVLGAQPHALQQLLAAVPAVAGAGRESEGLGTTCDDETRKGRTDTKGGDDDGLHIAFQYRRYIGRQQRLQRQREAKEAAQAQRGSSVGGGKGAKRARAPALSHAFDLLSPLPRGKLERATGLRTVEIERAAEGGRAVAEATREAVAGCAAQPSAIRVLVRSLGEEEAFSGGGGGEGQSLFARAVSLVSALRRIKAAIAPGAQPVAAALVTIPSALFDSDLASRLSSLADGIVRLDQVWQLYASEAAQAQVHEASKAACVLRVLRRPITHTLASHAPGTQHLLRVGRHRAALEPVQQPPEEGAERPTAVPNVAGSATLKADAW